MFGAGTGVSSQRVDDLIVNRNSPARVRERVPHRSTPMNRPFRFTALALGLALAGTALAQSQDNPSSTATSSSSAPSSAHQGKGQGQRAANPQQQLARLTKQLQLTSDQQAKIGPLLQSRDQQIQALRSDTSLGSSDRRAKIMSIMQDSTQQVDAQLTSAQRDQWKAMREKAMEHQQERRSQGVPSSASSSAASKP
jgi:periplasmic protein CpxP/Spy